MWKEARKDNSNNKTGNKGIANSDTSQSFTDTMGNKSTTYSRNNTKQTHTMRHGNEQTTGVKNTNKDVKEESVALASLNNDKFPPADCIQR